MITRELSQTLDELKLTAIKSHVEMILKQHDLVQDSFNLALLELLNIQLAQNRVNAQLRHRKTAKLRWPAASLSDIDYRKMKSLNRRDVQRLASCAWVEEHSHIVLIGPTGTAKTTLACAFANELIAHNIKVVFYRYHDLLVELQAAENEANSKVFKRLMTKLVRIPVLIIDDWGITPLTATQRRLLFDLIERREDIGSLIITSQYDPNQWHIAFGDVTTADAVLDRIVHMANIFNFKGVDSFRKQNGESGGISHVKS
jgi:DNA replication protein DnaC